MGASRIKPRDETPLRRQAAREGRHRAADTFGGTAAEGPNHKVAGGGLLGGKGVTGREAGRPSVERHRGGGEGRRNVKKHTWLWTASKYLAKRVIVLMLLSETSNLISPKKIKLTK